MILRMSDKFACAFSTGITSARHMRKRRQRAAIYTNAPNAHIEHTVTIIRVAKFAICSVFFPFFLLLISVHPIFSLCFYSCCLRSSTFFLVHWTLSSIFVCFCPDCRPFGRQQIPFISSGFYSGVPGWLSYSVIQSMDMLALFHVTAFVHGKGTGSGPGSRQINKKKTK